MESGNGGASRKGGVLVPVSESSGIFQNNILAPLKSAYLYEESKQSFRYTSAVLVNSPALEEKYCAFRAKRKEVGYSEEDLKESYGFLLFDDVNKANALGETGVLTGNSTCTTLGDPSKGVYISMYSDCLDLNRWYHGKSGYIAIIRLTKGRVNKVLENYTQNFTAPTVGFDCHVSEQLPSVSAKTSSFLAFERTQYYMYELLDDGSNVTTQSPSAACPFAIVSFSYTDTKATIVASQEKSEVKNLVCHYFPWKGQLQIGSLFYDVGLRSTVALIPAELPPVVKIDRAISMSDLRQLLPRAVFETCFSGEVFLDGLYFSLYELVSSNAEETNSLPLLLREIKEKDLALTIQLNDGGFLILLHSSHFLTYDDTGSSATDVLQGMFVFPVSQVIQTDTKSGAKKPAISSEILQVLQVLNYAEGEVEKIPMNPGEELCEVLAQHMQRYAALINPGLASSPARELSIFPDQYDVPDAHKHLYSCPELTNRAWQSFRSYLSKPVSFQLPLSKASEILAPKQEERIEDLDDDVYICLSSPEEAPANPVSMESEDQLTGQRSPVNIETPVDSCITSAEAQVDLTPVPQNVVPDDLHAGDATKCTGKSDLTALIKTDDMGAKNVLTPSTSDDLPAELIVSITSAERTVTDESLGMISTVSATMHNDIQLSGFSTAKLQMTGVNSLNDETVATKNVLDCSEFTNLTKTQKRKLRRGHYKGRKRVSKACAETPSLQLPVEDDNLRSPKEDQAKESSGHPQLSNPSYIERRKVHRRKCKFIKPSSSVGLAVAEEEKIDPGQQSFESTCLMELEAFPLRKKTERWDLKPVISECGRILVPHGSLDIANQIKSLRDQSTKDEKMLVDASVKDTVEMEQESSTVKDTVEMEQESSTAPKTAEDETEATTSKDGGNHFQTVPRSDVNPEHNILRPSDDGNVLLTLNQESTEHSSKTDGTATSPSEAVKEKHTNTLSLEKIATKGELLLSKLKSVLLRGKRKMDFLVSKETADTAQDTEPHLKKDKVDSDTGMLKSNYTITSVQDTNVHAKEVSKMLSVDPLFAYALGLTPKETPDKIEKTEGRDTQLRTDSSETQEQTILDKPPQIIHRPPSIFPRRGRIKMLKKHQGVSADNVKKKWWLHFQTPACYASEKLNYKECTRDNSVRKTVKEKMNSACSSTDALNLLADLALSASNDQVPPQPDPALERKPETSLKKCDLTKDVTTAEQESVLHALLRQPAARSMQPLESPSPSHLMGGSELVGLVSKEHAYSLPPSSSLLLGLPGTPFQVSPLSGSTRLLHHHQTLYGDGIKTLHPSVSQTDRSEKNHRTPEDLKKHVVCRRKFRHSRTFVDKDGSIQVTKQWKENYDFNLDSKFTNDSKDRTIVRALHGPWDFSMQDTSEEVRLIVHMWIGLFYSRSTARFFHVDSYPCSEESDSLEMPSGMVSTLALSDLKAHSFAPFPIVTDTSDPLISKALDLSKKHASVLDQGSVVLDLSLRNSNAEIVTSEPQVNRKETSVSGDLKEASETLNTLKSSMGLQEESKIQCNQKKVHYTDIINEINDPGSTYESKRKIAGSLENTDVPSCKDDRTFIVVQDEMKSVSVQPENNPTASGIGHVFHGCNNEKTDMKDGLGNNRKKAGSLEHTDVPSCKGDETFIVVQKEMESVSVQPENNPTASGIGHMFHGCNNEETDVKHSIENKRKKAGSLEHTDVPSCKGDKTFIVVHKEMESVSVQPENNQTASGIGHVFHGCNNEKTDMKDGLENKMKKAGILEHTDVPSCKGDETFIVVQKQMESVSVQPENNPTASGIGHMFHGCNNEETDVKHSIENKRKKAGSLEHTDVPSCKGDKTFIVVHKEMESVSVQPENNQTASGIGHVFHGCNNEKTDMKDGLGNNRKKAGRLEHTDVPSCKGDETFIVVQKEMESVSVQPENNQTASGIGHVFHGCNNEKTDMKDGLENKMKKAGILEHTDVPSCKGDETFIVVQKEMESVSVQPENNQTASGIGHVFHGCNNEKTDMKDGLENEMKKAGILEHTDVPSCKGDETFIVVQKEMESVSVPPENNQTASGIGHMFHGCNNEKTDMKDGLENKMKKAGILEHTDVPSCKGDEAFIVVQKEMESVTVQPENNLTASGICHVLHGCNNEETDAKDGIKNSEATAMSLVQKHGKDSSKCVTVVEVDSNKEAGDVVLTVKHDAIESKDGENLEVKENPYQQGNVEPFPKVILTDDDSTNKESGIVCNGYLLENEKQLSVEEPISVSPGQAENVNKDVDCCTVYKGKVIEDEDPCGKENGFDEKDSWVSPVEANSELSDQPLPMNCDGPDSVKKDCITECNQKPPFDEQPPKDNNEEDACHDLQLRKLCANGSVLTDEHGTSEKSPHASSEMEPYNEPAVEGNSKNDICLADKAHYQKAALPMSDENNCSLDVSNANGSIPQTNDSVETECQNKVMANFNLISVDHEDGDTQSIEGDQKVVNTTEKELFYNQAHSPQCEAEAALTKETDLKRIEKTNEELEKIFIVGVIPFIGIDTSREDTVQQHDTHSQGKVEEVDQEEIPFISKTTYPETVQPTGLCSTSQMNSKKPELSAGKISLSLLDVSEIYQPVISGSESDDRCPTPTMDEKPFQYLTCSGPSNTSASALSGSETSKNMTQKCLSTGSISRKDEVPHKSTFNSDARPHHDLELRTHRVLQSIEKFRYKTSHTKTSIQIDTAEKHSLDQTPNPKNKYTPTCFATSHTSSDFKDNKMQCNTTPAVMSASTSPELHTESTSNFLISPFKSKLEEVLGVKLQLKKTNLPVHQHYFERIDKLHETSVGQDCHPYRSAPCTESLQAIKPNIDQGRHKTTSQSNLSHELRSYSQRPVMAVKPSKSDECQADCISEDRQIENAIMSHFSVNKPTETPKVTYTIPTTMFLETKTESFKENSEGLNDDKQDASELSSKSSWLSNVSDSKSNSDKAKCVLQDPLKQHQGRDISKLNKIPLSSFPAQSFESAKHVSKLVDGNQGFITYSLVEKVGQTTKESIEIDQKDCSDASTSHAVYKDGGITDDSLFLGPQSSLMCTVYNTSRKRSYSFLEQVSQRCLQDDPTEASMEQECLIFSEQMKQLLKRSKRGPVRQQGTHDELNLPCASPVTVHFCNLEEQEDSVDHLNAHFDAPSLVGQKIKVNMSDRKKTTEEDETHPPNVSQRTGNPMEHAGVSAVTSECVKLYEAMMNDVCAVKKVPSRPHKRSRIHRSYPKAEPSNHFDFCDQMKREVDESFRSNLNSVVKKSCKTKYRFYVLLTSDDAFFEETKAQLEAEGHTAVQPSEFFLGEDSSSSLLIILRNEDIAEHICEVPHLLELKKSPGAQFAGIDEPDDVVNLTHQELFTRGGFVMFDRAALESLSFWKMKKMSEILQERSRTGKWKWMLHYRDSRRLKESARLSAEAKEKHYFLNWCQEAGISEVLPYHECDLMSREQPDYLACLVRLQVQNISARYPVFITDTTTDSAFEKNGILTMTFDSFLTYSPSTPITA